MNGKGQQSNTEYQSTGIPFTKDRFQPKLRKNRKTELKWGIHYHEAINKAVFTNQYAAYMPSEPPSTIREDIDKTGYVCKQCRDCFRFLSSIEEHTARRSWILGFWCQLCFVTTCVHKPKGQLICSQCAEIEASKSDYLQSKGIRRNLRKGVTRVFYNQCQFFAHLRSHGITYVDSTELMLMPLPSGIQRENYAALDRVFQALMEVMFIRGIHLMDWLKDKKIAWNALASPGTELNAISEIVKSYADNCLPITRAIHSRQDNPIQFEDSRRRANQIHANANQSQFRLALAKSREENESRATNDIAFVDCGPTPNNCTVVETSKTNLPTSESSKSRISKDNQQRPRPKVIPSSTIWRSFPQHDKIKDKTSDVFSKSTEDRAGFSSSTSINPSGPRVLTIRSPKCLSLSTIIKHLPDGVNRKNIVETRTSNTDKSVASVSNSKETATNDKTKIPTNPISNTMTVVPSSDKTTPAISANLVTQSFSEQMSLHGRIVFQNGRKYIIRPVPKNRKSKYRAAVPGENFRSPLALPALAPFTTAKSIVTTKLHQSITKPIPILPKPMPPTKPRIQQPSNQNQASTTKIVKVLPKASAPINQFTSSRMTEHQKTLMSKFREMMLKSLVRLSKLELDTYVEHFKSITHEYSKAIGTEKDAVIATNTKAIQCFERIASYVSSSKSTNGEIYNPNPDDSFEINAKEWELRIRDFEMLRDCDTCDKKIKPARYLVGLSGPAVDEKKFCCCYNNVCHLCNANQDSVAQLKAHIRWHKGEKPFACPECTITFPSSVELEVHVWTTCFHPMARYMFGCGVCEIEGIMDMEGIARHYFLVHTKRKIVCSECKMEYTGIAPTYTDFTKHFVKHHPDIENITEPKRFFHCNLKQCIIRPEMFRSHLNGHVGVLKWVDYKCPFCSMITHDSVHNKSAMREHLVENHLDKIHEIVSPASLQRILEGLKIVSNNLSTSQNSEFEGICPPVSNADTSGPMIINARTITPASFEHASENSEELVHYNNSIIPKILEVRSEAVEEFDNNDFQLQIISVESMADNSLESPAIESEISDAVSQESAYDDLTPLSDDTCESVGLEICSLPLKNDDEARDTDDDCKTKISINRDTENEDANSIICISDSSEKYEETRLDSPTKRKKFFKKKPWRIALNSPMNVETTPVTFNCHLCGEVINTCWSVINNHFNTHHSGDYTVSVISPKIPRVSVNYINGGYKDDSSGSKRKIEVPVVSPGPKRRRRWGPKKFFERPGSPSLGLCVRPEPVQEVEGIFRCKKCDEPFKDRAVLREHIASNHRIKGQYLICLECGENFVVVPSLQMHLKALHGIQDPITYLSQNTSYAPDVLDDVEELEKTTESNQCYVCMAVFEDKAAVDKHIRVHGMAFLKRKKFEAQKARKSSEKDKKSEPPDVENKSSNVEDRKSVVKNDSVGTIEGS